MLLWESGELPEIFRGLPTWVARPDDPANGSARQLRPIRGGE